MVAAHWKDRVPQTRGNPAVTWQSRIEQDRVAVAVHRKAIRASRQRLTLLEAEKKLPPFEEAQKQLPILRAALRRHQQTLLGDQSIASKNRH